MTSMPHSDTSSRPPSRQTGFPEPFCGSRNTTLPHPDADTSPNASISQDDIAISRVESRQRRSFRAKNKRTISHGLITPEMEQMYSDLVAVTSDSESSPTREDLERLPTIPGTPAMGHLARPPSKDGAISLESTSTGDNRKSMEPDPKNFRSRLSSDVSSTKSRKKSFMQRLGIPHHRS
ncbi:hypothetical protein Daus18300_007435 [Diaporthe australafricana]|uniref:Uncharacterized protein n=1 Tax=Diaporthe australafricana TaxID=127596 RepID=A0ABR3WMP8_9PEZI